MIVDLFIVTYKKDFPYLEHCLRSIDKFATGFRAIHLIIPKEDKPALLALLQKMYPAAVPSGIPLEITYGTEWPGKGMCWHMAQIISADTYSDADYFCHLDSDCIFTGPVTPDTYIKNGRPILRYERFNEIRKRHPGAAAWQKPCRDCLPFEPHFETMRCHPEVYRRDLYAKTREFIQMKTGQNAEDYIRTQRNEFPQTFCEFNTLGNVAMHHFYKDYLCVEQYGDWVEPDNHLQQFWSHTPPEQPQKIWVGGVEKEVVPIQMIKKVLA